MDAFSIFINETKPRRPHHLVLVGNQDWGGYEVLEKKIEAESIRDRIHFAGYVDQKDLPAFYRGSELFAYPSLFEGFGLPLLEAMAAGAPCLTSNRPALTEVGADVAEYCDPTSVQDMSSKLKNLIEDPEKLSDMRVKGRQYARRFTWERTALSTIRIYEDVLGTPII
jgi:glycosyltransferase involved in cell wall biosynthesis